MSKETDRELLELAAKAAGLKPDGSFGQGILTVDAEGRAKPFDPLTGDGDALRLAVDLKLDIAKLQANAGIEWDSPDRYAATRRAIVRAAAEIGKDKQ